MNMQFISRVIRPRLATAPIVVLTVLCATLEASAQPLLIVSAGDSYASGEGAPDDQWNAAQRWEGDNYDGGAWACHRSNRAAAADAARRLSAGWPVDFASVACSGSQTGAGPFDVPYGMDGAGAILEGQKSLLGNSGQLASIYKRFTANPYYPNQPARAIDALVLSIGGNDIGFAKLVENCIKEFGCDRTYAGYVAQKLVELPGRLRQVINAVNGGAAGKIRHVFLVQYPDPTTTIWGWRCGTPLVGNPEGLVALLSEAEATWASTAIVAPLNAILANAVEEANNGSGPEWHIVDVAEQFQGHGYCNFPWDRFINTQIDSLFTQGDSFGTMHPNALGQSALADALTPAMWFLTEPKAEFLAQSVPSTMLPGQSYPVSVTMKNTGSVTWTPQDAIRLGSQSPQEGIWGLHRVELPGPIEPGEVVTFNFLVTAPAQPGNYAFQWRMVQEFVQWFGAFTPSVTVNVPSPNRQMSVQVVENWSSSTNANITVYATDVGTGAPVSGSITLNGVVVGHIGQPFTYTRVVVKVCEPEGRRVICFSDFVEQELAVSGAGYDAVSFARQ